MRIESVSALMYRAILPEGQIVCESFEHRDEGIELYDDEETFVAFVPYSTLNALIDEDTYGSDERSIM